MFKRLAALLFFIFTIQFSIAQRNVEDTIFLMNGHVIGQRVVDTTFNTVSILNPKKLSSKIHYDWDQLYMVKFANGNKRYYYVQDSTINNWFTRDEMWMYMKGERDARKGFKATGSLIGAGVAGLLGGLTGTFWGPIAPYSYMALSGVTKVKIRHNTVSDPRYLESDGYILGYERVARQRRKIWSLIGGTAGLILGYSFYAAFHQHYPETINFGFNK
jgi:hypothetical protein